jgi:hypothetical protein
VGGAGERKKPTIALVILGLHPWDAI